ncbi:leucine-rich repeat-containing 59 [Pelobates cultripes]|nr:leucine-rich repeat-containing 59 [Pelobates cultripes]
MSRNTVKAGNLRDKLDGNELDLSLSDLNEIPVRELAALPKATVLDLSCNKFTTLPGEFCSLTHIVRLDLSKNQLKHLPSEFGRLVNLQHLDLFQNQLTMLPDSFAHLKNLKWLDLKDNPLNLDLAKVAGDCLDEKQCKECAQAVLIFMKVIQSEHDQEMQRKLLEERAQKQKREVEQRKKEERERELRRREKAKQKERKRKDYNALQAAQRQVAKNSESEKKFENHNASVLPSKKQKQRRTSWKGILGWFLLFMFIMAIGCVVVCRWTHLQKHSICYSPNAVSEEIMNALHSYQILERVLQPPGSQQQGQ